MNEAPDRELRELLEKYEEEPLATPQRLVRFKNKLRADFRSQLTWGAPSNEDESALRRLVDSIREGRISIKLFARHPLHAKLYLIHREDDVTPRVGYLGSSNLTFAGLSKNGELNVDVTDTLAVEQLCKWFEDRWNDRQCIDITADLLEIIEDSWITERDPYYIYIKMAYHLSFEARAGMNEFAVPQQFRGILFPFQQEAVTTAVRYLMKRGGVFIGDVVGLGKTFTATALAKLLEDTYDFDTLIIAPKNLVSMWREYRTRYRLRAKVISMSMVTKQLHRIERSFRTVLIDESHNLRNHQTRRYQAIKEYIEKHHSRVILLSATPYNKTFGDLADQLRLFLPEDKDLPVRPERLMREIGETEFKRRHQCSPRSLRGFEKSEYAQDWQEIMRLFLIRRTRSFIQQAYAKKDNTGRFYLQKDNDEPFYFPKRIPKSAVFNVRENDPSDTYARLYDEEVVKRISSLAVPRYGLGNYESLSPSVDVTLTEKKQLANLGRAGRRLMGFCRTNLFKRLESSGYAFLLTVERHLLRNYLFLHAIEKGLPLPIGTQDQSLIDQADKDADDYNVELHGYSSKAANELRTPADFKKKARELYQFYQDHYQRKFQWMRPELFAAKLHHDLLKDCETLHWILDRAGSWDSSVDQKLLRLHDLIQKEHPKDKLLVFTQFADTAEYLGRELKRMGVNRLEAVTGESKNTTIASRRFSPMSNASPEYRDNDQELRVLISTDVLSEGQNLQDSHIIVNFDIPWAIIRLIQRAGRVDRIGQRHSEIFCYSFWPSDGINNLIHLRDVIRRRLTENNEVLGADEAFFEDEADNNKVKAIYVGDPDSLNDPQDFDTDLPSKAYAIWKEAIDADPNLERIIPAMSDVVHGTRQLEQTDTAKEKGVLVFVRSSTDTNQMIYLNHTGKIVTESQSEILDAARCAPDTRKLKHETDHHALVDKAKRLAQEQEKSLGGSLGSPSDARYKVYKRLEEYKKKHQGTFFDTPELDRVLNAIYRNPLKDRARELLRQRLKVEPTDEELLHLCTQLYEEDRLCAVTKEGESPSAVIVCSMGLK